MINWAHVAFNAVWIVGCAVVLAAFSHAHWLAPLRGLRTRQLWNAPAFQLPFTTGLFLICLGLFLLGHGWLEHGVWAFFAVVFAWQSWSLWRSSP